MFVRLLQLPLVINDAIIEKYLNLCFCVDKNLH